MYGKSGQVQGGGVRPPPGLSVRMSDSVLVCPLWSSLPGSANDHPGADAGVHDPAVTKLTSLDPCRPAVSSPRAVVRPLSSDPYVAYADPLHPPSDTFSPGHRGGSPAVSVAPPCPKVSQGLLTPGSGHSAGDGGRSRCWCLWGYRSEPPTSPTPSPDLAATWGPRRPQGKRPSPLFALVEPPADEVSVVGVVYHCHRGSATLELQDVSQLEGHPSPWVGVSS